MQLPESMRLDTLAEGLELLVEHVATLRTDAAHLAQAERRRGFVLLSALAEEEAAKVLILLDLVRMGWREQKPATRQICHFYDHLARLIYVDAARFIYEDFAELCYWVRQSRESHYLDGPNDVDWIFRNRLIAEREESLYVDYIRDEGGDGHWITPALYQDGHFAHETDVLDLIGALHRCGCTSRRGLEIIADTWTTETIGARTHWHDLVQINRRILTQLVTGGVGLPDATPEDRDRVTAHWPFPLSGLDLSRHEVPPAELDATRARSLSTSIGLN
jgi:AbiV family abortive infection protein